MIDTNQASTPVTEAAKALATALKTDERYAEWRSVADAFEQNEELKKLMIRFQELAQKAQIAQQGGAPLSNDEVAEVATLQKSLQEDVLFMKHNKATSALLEMLHSANEAVSSEIGLDFAANAAPVG